MKQLFTPEDFKPVTWYADEVANLANAKLAKLIESWPVVYGSSKRPLDGWNEKSYESSTHKARLAFIEELPKPECKHDPLVTVETKHIKKSDSPLFRTEYSHAVCRLCGVEIVAKWEEKR